jgi:hypothetical protein
MMLLPFDLCIGGRMLNRVAVAVWFGVCPFDVSNLVDVWHIGQQQNEKNPK